MNEAAFRELCRRHINKPGIAAKRVFIGKKVPTFPHCVGTFSRREKA